MLNDLQKIDKTLESLQAVNVIASDKPSGYDASAARNPSPIDICPGSHINARSEDAKCSRCRETARLILRSGRFDMLNYGLNLWYCSRGAALVGWA
jgi:hypothetical protein